VPPLFVAGATSLGPMTGAGRRVLLGWRLFFPRLGSVYLRRRRPEQDPRASSQLIPGLLLLVERSQ